MTARMPGPPVFFQQVPEVHDGGVFRVRRAQCQTREQAHERDFLERLFHGRGALGKSSFAAGECAIWFPEDRVFCHHRPWGRRALSAPAGLSRARPDASRRGSVHGGFACACRRIQWRKSSFGSRAVRIRRFRILETCSQNP